MKRFYKALATYFAVLLFIIITAFNTNAQSKINQDSIQQKMGWFEDAKLGIFIHYGICLLYTSPSPRD